MVTDFGPISGYRFMRMMPNLMTPRPATAEIEFSGMSPFSWRARTLLKAWTGVVVAQNGTSFEVGNAVFGQIGGSEYRIFPANGIELMQNIKYCIHPSRERLQSILLLKLLSFVTNLQGYPGTKLPAPRPPAELPLML